LIQRENGEILSDNRIVDILMADGVNIARRTVAKYREAMRIPSSAERRRLSQADLGPWKSQAHLA
jgi:RNA polymerase sigma-54 factor